MDYQEIVERRRALMIEPYKSLAEVGFDGPWVMPYQITSKSSEGPVLVALHWLDESSILREPATLQNFGYLPSIRFCTVIDAALAHQGLSRSDIYVTQTFHLIPPGVALSGFHKPQSGVRSTRSLALSFRKGK